MSEHGGQKLALEEQANLIVSDGVTAKMAL